MIKTDFKKNLAFILSCDKYLQSSARFLLFLLDIYHVYFQWNLNKNKYDYDTSLYAKTCTKVKLELRLLYFKVRLFNAHSKCLLWIPKCIDNSGVYWLVL